MRCGASLGCAGLCTCCAVLSSTAHTRCGCRHAFGDQYRATDMVVDGPGKLEMTFTPADGGKPQQFTIYDFKGGWVGGWVDRDP